MKFSEFNSTSFQGKTYCLTSVIETLQAFSIFEPLVKKLEIALHAQELGINSLHFYAIALHAGLGGAL